MHRSLLARLSGRPLALAPRALEGLLAAVPSDVSTEALAKVDARGLALHDDTPRPSPGFTITDAGIAVVPVVGLLVTRGDLITAFLGIMDYGEVAGAVEAAFADPSVRAVLLEVDSPGGEVGGLFDLVDRIAALRGAAGKPLWAVASEAALSAAYAIASAADRLYVTRTAEVGSVGVVAVHVDESGADAQAGLKWTLIHAGAKKVDGNAHAPLSDRALSDIQADVDALHAELVALVAANRGMTPEAVRATEAAIFRGRRGIEAGFADLLGTVDVALADLAATLDPPPQPMGAARGTRTIQPPRSMIKMTTEPETAAETAATIEQETPTPTEVSPSTPPVPEVPSETPAAPASPQPSAGPRESADAAARLRAEYAEIAAVAAQAGRLGVAIDAADAMAKGIRPDALRRSVLDALATRAEANVVVAAAPQAPTAGDSPIVRRARERASASRA
ncbi:hypothetical protein GCM10007972_24750 [Iodidimonas muriae]|uniref:Peptidase S49 domain-containing protein n=1 Tax=Iodidimonas muriae TaxID=261467 RepID=A0ABQ2LFR2_9PROT|nr:S49 family peptidase [Iodidimonas muriae]GGO16095.1 hypothetical protein GCM10007972_24750 [Iodidimonas muriae]